MSTVFIQAICCEVTNRPGVAHVTNLLGHLPETLRCAACAKEYRVDYNPTDLNRIADLEGKLGVAAQKAIDESHPTHGIYISATRYSGAGRGQCFALLHWV